MKKQTLAIIKDHIRAGEKAVPFPYLDTKGDVTIGIGHKIENYEEFRKLSIKVGKPGHGLVPATHDDMQRAWDALQAEKDQGNYGPDVQARDFQGVTGARMTPNARCNIP